MKLPRSLVGARHIAALGIASLALLAVVSPQAAAKRAITPNGKQVSKANPERAIDMKTETPGAAYAAQWDSFQRGVVTAQANKGAVQSLYGDSPIFARFSAITGAPRIVYGDLGEAPAAAKTGDRAMLFLQANAHVFGIDTTALKFARAFAGGGKPDHFYYDQTYKGLPVFYGEVAVHMGRDGHVWGVTNTYTPVSDKSINPTVSADAAYQAALAAIGVTDNRQIVSEFPSQQTLGIFPTAGGGLLAFKVTVSTNNPTGHFETIIDANTGEILEAPFDRDCYVDGVGKVFTPNPVVSEGINNLTDGTAIPDSYYKPVTLMGLNGPPNDKLIGQYSQPHPSMPNPAVRANLDFSDLRRTSSNFNYNEEQVYWAIDFGERAFQALGYTTGNGNPIMSYPIYAYAHNAPDIGGSNVDNSHFNPDNSQGSGTGHLCFGTGGVDDAQDSEIIWHEWGHATLWNERPGINQNLSSEGVGEGSGDYLAGTLSKRTIGAASYYVTVGEWDAVSYNPGNPAFLRRLDNPAFWHMNGTEVHDAGETWSHPCFDFDNQVGPDVALDIFLQAVFLFDLSPTQVEGAAAYITADQMLNQGACAGLINNAFKERHTIAGNVVPVVHTIGVSTPGSAAFFLRNSVTPGPADLTITYGASGQTPLVGDYDGNGSDTIGVYSPSNGFFFLRNSNTGGNADLTFQYGGGGIEVGEQVALGEFDLQS